MNLTTSGQIVHPVRTDQRDIFLQFHWCFSLHKLLFELQNVVAQHREQDFDAQCVTPLL